MCQLRRAMHLVMAARVPLRNVCASAEVPPGHRFGRVAQDLRRNWCHQHNRFLDILTVLVRGYNSDISVPDVLLT